MIVCSCNILTDQQVLHAIATATTNRPPTVKEVKTGLSDGLSVEIAEGLQEKDLVVERPPKKIE